MPRKVLFSNSLRVDYRPYQMVLVDGVSNELISFPYPRDPEKGDYEAWICVRFENDPTTLKHIPLSAVELVLPVDPR